MKHFEEEEQFSSSDSENSYHVSPSNLKETIMDRKLNLMRKRARLGFLKREKDRIKYYGLEATPGGARPKLTKNRNLKKLLIYSFVSAGRTTIRISREST